jgi:glycerol kinase
LESIAYQSADLLKAMEADCGRKLRGLRVDGGAVVNNALMQFQADLLRVPVVRPRTTETTALGAAYLAGLASGFWKNRREISALWAADRTFRAQAPATLTRRLLAEWHVAVGRAKS